MVAGLVAAAGCGGGVSSTSPPTTQTATVLVETVKQGTSDLLPVAATITVGGVTGVVDLVQGWAVISGVPILDLNAPSAPLTATAPGYVTVSQILTLNTYSYTSASIAMPPADPATTGTVEGTVTGPGGSPPLVNAVVTFTPASGTAVTGYTDRNGHFKFGGIPAGRVRAAAAATGYLESSQQITVVADSAGSNPPLSFSLLSGTTKVTVNGQVLRVGLDTPIAGAQVQIGSLDPVTTDAGGRFSVGGVLVGEQTIKVSATGYDDKQQNITVTPGMAALTLYLAPSSPQPPTFPYTITGKVTLLGKADNSGATVTALNKSLGQVMDTVTTYADGNYYLFVPPGSYRITVTYGTHSIGRDVTLLGGGRVLTGLDFTLSVGSG